MERDLWDSSVGVFCWCHCRGRRLIFRLEKTECRTCGLKKGLWDAGSLMLDDEDEVLGKESLWKCLHSAGECIYIPSLDVSITRFKDLKTLQHP